MSRVTNDTGRFFLPVWWLISLKRFFEVSLLAATPKNGGKIQKWRENSVRVDYLGSCSGLTTVDLTADNNLSCRVPFLLLIIKMEGMGSTCLRTLIYTASCVGVT